MRLWHYKLIPVLPDKMLVAQWRECIAIKRQWEKGTLKHRLVSYVMDYTREYFLDYVKKVVCELAKRNIKYQEKYYLEIDKFCWEDKMSFHPCNYPEHNNRYLLQCYYNLEEKYDRGIVSWDDFQKIQEVMRENE